MSLITLHHKCVPSLTEQIVIEEFLEKGFEKAPEEEVIPLPKENYEDLAKKLKWRIL